MFSFTAHYLIPNLSYVFFYLLCTSCVLIHRSLSHSEPLVCILLFVVYKLCSHSPLIISFRTSCMYSFICCVQAVFSFTAHYPIPNLVCILLFVVYKLCSHSPFIIPFRTSCMYSFICCVQAVFSFTVHYPIPNLLYVFFYPNLLCTVKLCSHSPRLHYPIPNLLYVFFYLLCTSCVLIHRFCYYYYSLVLFGSEYFAIVPNLLYVFFYLLCTSCVLIHRKKIFHYPIPNLLYSFICCVQAVFVHFSEPLVCILYLCQLCYKFIIPLYTFFYLFISVWFTVLLYGQEEDIPFYGGRTRNLLYCILIFVES